MNKADTFDIETYVGSEVGSGERPPRSAKHVATVGWSWGPAHSRCESYWLCTNRERSAWYLWGQSHDFETPTFRLCAAGHPYRGVDAKSAAEQLLLAAWRDEWNLWDDPGPGAEVSRSGLLNADDVARIESAAYKEEPSS